MSTTLRLKLTDLTPGDKVEADSGFICIHPGTHTVHKDEGGLFILCHGPDGEAPVARCHHYLDGQVGDDGYLIGLSRPVGTVGHA